METLVSNKTLRMNKDIRVEVVEKVTGNQVEKFVSLTIDNGWERAECSLTKRNCQELIETLKEMQGIL